MSVTEIWQVRREEGDSDFRRDPAYLSYVKRQIAHEFADFCALLFDCSGKLEQVTFEQKEERRDRETPYERTVHVYTIRAKVVTENEVDMLKLKQGAHS